MAGLFPLFNPAKSVEHFVAAKLAIAAASILILLGLWTNRVRIKNTYSYIVDWFERK